MAEVLARVTQQGSVMKLILDTAKFSLLTIIALVFAAIGILVTSLLGIKRSVATA